MKKAYSKIKSGMERRGGKTSFLIQLTTLADNVESLIAERGRIVRGSELRKRYGGISEINRLAEYILEQVTVQHRTRAGLSLVEVNLRYVEVDREPVLKQLMPIETKSRLEAESARIETSTVDVDRRRSIDVQ